MALTIGEVLDGKYRVVRLIGEGGMGAVYEGEHVLIRRRVAIKTLLHLGEEFVQRFEREAQAAGTIGNDHILEVLDLGRLSSGSNYMVMEYLDGETLASRVRVTGKITAEETGVLMRQVLRGLAAAHAAGVIHRDLKPDNIFILREKAGRRDFVKIIDFGISKFASTPEMSRMTRAGAILGTPSYMSPEQARGSGEVDERSDIYAVGVIMYEAISGKLPFDGSSFNDLMFNIVLGEAQDLRDAAPGVDSAFAAIVMKAMAKDPANRHATVGELLAAIEGWMRSRTMVLGSDSAPPAEGAAPAVRLPAPSNPDLRDVHSTAILQPGTGGTPVLVQAQHASGAFAAASAAASSGAPRHASRGSLNDSTLQERSWAASQATQSKRSLLPFGIGAAVLVLLGVVGVVAIGSRRTDPAVGKGMVASATPSASHATAPPPVSAEPVASAAVIVDPPSALAVVDVDAGAASKVSGAGPTGKPKPSAPAAVVTPPVPRPKPTPSAKSTAPDFGY